MIKQRLEEVMKNIEKHKKSNKAVVLVAVTKTRAVKEIEEAIAAGVKDIGESRVQEAEEKFEKLKKNQSLRWHLIGALQSNKVKKAAQMFDFIHSIDRLKTAEKLNEECKLLGKTMNVFIEINISGEKTKRGLNPEEVGGFYNKVKWMANIKILGLMAIAPLVAPEQTRPYFRKLTELSETLGLEHISAGMTNDYSVALEEGADFLRIGTAIFGERRK